MSDTGLKFGPEWMRVLSHGGSGGSVGGGGGGGGGNTTGPTHSVMSKGKQAAAEHRYTRDKMIELWTPMDAPVTLVKDPADICDDHDYPMVPLAYTDLTPEEQRIWQRNINSESAVRLMSGVGGGGSSSGRGGGGSGMVGLPGGGNGGGGGLSSSSSTSSLGGGSGGLSRGRGSSMDRGRGRGRGMSQYYIRGISHDEDMMVGEGGNRTGAAPPGMALRRGNSGLGSYERSASLSSGMGGLSATGGGGDGRAGSMGAWGVPPPTITDHCSASGGGSYHVSQGLDHSSSRGSIQGEERLGASSPRKEQGRASADNWRSRDGLGGGGDPALQDHWRSGLSTSLSGSRLNQDKWGASRGITNNGWRPRDSAEDGLGGYSYSGGGYSRGGGRGGMQQPQQRSRQPWSDGSSKRNWPDEDRLPEWATDFSQERAGSFDASGAYHSQSWCNAEEDNNFLSGNPARSKNPPTVAGAPTSTSESIVIPPPPTNGVGGSTSSSSDVTPPPSTSSSYSSATQPPPPPLTSNHNSKLSDDGQLNATTPTSQHSIHHDHPVSGPAGSCPPYLNGEAPPLQKQQNDPTNPRNTHNMPNNNPPGGLGGGMGISKGPHHIVSQALVNGYGGRDSITTSSSSSGDTSHEGSSSPLMGRSHLHPPPSSIIVSSSSSSTTLHGGNGGRSLPNQQHPVSTSSGGGGSVRALMNASNIQSVDNSTTGRVMTGLRSLHLDQQRHMQQQQQQHVSLAMVSGSDTVVTAADLNSRHTREEDNLEHMQMAADALVSKLVDEEPKQQPQLDQQQSHLQGQQQHISLKQGPAAGLMAAPTPPAGFMPIPQHHVPIEDTHEWYYTDPQQEVQGPFSAINMISWYNNGYFSDNLLLKRDCDDKFAKLGDLKILFGRVPFFPGPPCPPLKVTLTSEDAERQQQQQAAAAEANKNYEKALQEYAIQKQVYDNQMMLRQHQVLQQLSALDSWNTLPEQTQRQLFVQQMISLPAIPEPIPPTRPPSIIIPSTAPSSTPLSMLGLNPGIPANNAPTTTPSPDPNQKPGTPGTVLSHHNTPPPGTIAPHSVTAAGVHPSSVAITDSSQSGKAPAITGGVSVRPTLQHFPSSHSRLPQPGPVTTPSQHAPQGMPPVPGVGPLQPHQVMPQQQPTRDPIQDFMHQLSAGSNANKTPAMGPATDSATSNIVENNPAILQQMQSKHQRTTVSSHGMPVNTSSLTPMDKIGVPEENPLQNLLLQLQQKQNNGAHHPQSGAFPVSTDAMGLPSNAAQLPSGQASQPQSATAGNNVKGKQLTQQEDVIQSFMLHLTKMQQEKDMADAASAQQETASNAEDDKKQKKAEEERRKADAQRVRKEQEAAAHAKKMDENMKKKSMEEQRKKEQEEEKKKTADNKRKEEQEKRQKQKQKQEEAQKRQEEKKRQEEEQRKRAEEKKREQAEEQRRQAALLEEERRRLHKIQQEELAKQARLEEARLQQQQQKAWGTLHHSQPADRANGQSNTPSLIEIQKIQQEKEKMERERQLKEEEMRKEAQREAAEKKRAAASMNLKWAAKLGGGSSNNNVKSLLQIQQEEEKELKKRQSREQHEGKTASVSSHNAGVGVNTGAGMTANNSTATSAANTAAGANNRGWGTTAQPISWASRASSSAPNNNKNWNDNFAWNNNGQQSQLSSGGFWESNTDNPKAKTAAAVAAARTPTKPGSAAVAATAKTAPAAARQAKVQPANNKQSANSTSKVNHNNNNNTAKTVAAGKKKGAKDEGENRKCGGGGQENKSPAEEFSKWCKDSLDDLKKVTSNSIDVPTFVNFLRDVESPYEVHDYIRSYLGDTREVKEFAKNYLERRSQVLNASRRKNVSHDDILAPAPAINPASENFQETKMRKQKSKKKMQKVVDSSSILGFNVNAKDRVNGGDHSGQ